MCTGKSKTYQGLADSVMRIHFPPDRNTSILATGVKQRTPELLLTKLPKFPTCVTSTSRD